MLSFLKKPKPVADLVYYDDGVVHFRCEAGLAPGKVATLLCRVPEGPEFEAQMAVQSGQPTPELYQGVIQKPPNTGEFLSVLLPRSFVERRREARVLKSIRVRSQEVEGYRAMTLNLSWSGLCLVVDGPVDPGRRISVQLEWDVPDVRPLSAEVEVLWCQPQPGGTRAFLAGCRFMPLGQQQRSRLKDFFDHQAGRGG